jgi:uncharacterized cupredoxin-like copper-binding protein
MGIPPTARIALPTLVAAIALAGCGGTPPPAPGSVLGIGERDFHITAPARTSAGEVTLRVHNAGPDTHELFIVRAPQAASLPLRADAMTVDESAIETRTVTNVDAIAPGSTRDAHLRLAPGRYLLFCNMAGHYRGGMHSELVVS